MEWKEYESKKRFRRVITNTFSSNEDCEMFIMVLKQQWPKHINKLPDSELEITIYRFAKYYVSNVDFKGLYAF